MASASLRPVAGTAYPRSYSAQLKADLHSGLSRTATCVPSSIGSCRAHDRPEKTPSLNDPKLLKVDPDRPNPICAVIGNDWNLATLVNKRSINVNPGKSRTPTVNEKKLIKRSIVEWIET
jgi:hypothetical protein